MSSTLSEMSLEDLWELFPIFLEPHQAVWKEWYEEETSLLMGILPHRERMRISHIGSTSVCTIWAKPIVDILIEVPDDSDMEFIKSILEDNGYLCMSRGNRRISFNKGYTENGFAERVFHLHLRYIGDHDELYFRDYLIENPDIAHEYERLKLRLWKEFEHDRDSYTDSKSDFVAKYTQIAKEKYDGNKSIR